MPKKIGVSAGNLPKGDHGEFILARQESDMKRKLNNPPPQKERNNPKATTKELKQMEKDAKTQKKRAEKKGPIQVRWNEKEQQYEQSKDGKKWVSVKEFHDKVDALMRKLSEIGVSGEKEEPKGGKRRRKSRKRKSKKRRKKRRTRRKSRRKRRRKRRR